MRQAIYHEQADAALLDISCTTAAQRSISAWTAPPPGVTALPELR